MKSFKKIKNNGQATMEYFILFVIFASLTFLGVSRFKNISDYLNKRHLESFNGYSGYRSRVVDTWNWNNFDNPQDQGRERADADSLPDGPNQHNPNRRPPEIR